MKIDELNERLDINENVKLNMKYVQFGNLITELRKRELSDSIIESINADIRELNSISNTTKELRSIIMKKQNKIVKLIEKELKIVPRNYYRQLWLAVGMSVFGMPIGLCLGLFVGNIGLLGIGLPIGMVIGMAIGKGMDDKAFEEGRQLDVEIK